MTERAHESDSELSEVDRLLLACVEAAASEQETVLDSLCRAHPELAEDLRLRWGLLGQVGFLAGGPDRTASLPDRIGGFRIVRRLGGGGMGVVYLAEQEDLGREVALKVLRPEFAASDRARERFRREGVTLSKLEHPGICPVYEVGEVEGMPYLAMRYLEGHTLAELVAAAQGQALSGSVWLAGSSDGETPSEGTGERARMGGILRVFEKIACAVHAAHEEGLVHRDLKPANVMIGRDGEPVVLDFGLAWDEAGDVGLTHSGDVLGTPAYLAPEQVEGRRRADRRTDVYALGVTLYECLTLNRPFQGSNREALYRQILGGEFADVRTRNRHVPRDLAVVVALAMDRNPERRYVSALELAEDLRRVRTHEPIAARPAGVVLRSWRWTQRNPVVAAFLLFLVLGLGWTAVMLGREREILRQTQALAVTNLAYKVAQSEPKAGLWLALEALVRDERPETISQVYSALGLSHEERRLVDHGAVVFTVGFSPIGRYLVSTSDDWTARVWDLQEHGAQPVVLPHDGAVHDAVFVGGEDRVLTASVDGTARLWRWSEGDPSKRELHRFGEVGSEWISGVRLGPASRTALLLQREHPMLVDLDGPRVLHPLKHAGRIWDGCFSRNGELAVTAEGYGTEPPPRALCTARVWRVASGKLICEVEHRGSIGVVRFTPDGLLLTGSRDKTAQLWDPNSGDPVGEPFQQNGRIWSAAMPREVVGEAVFALGGGGGAKIRLWALHPERREVLREHALIGMAKSLVFSPDEKSLLAALFDGTARLYDSEGWETRVFRGHSGRVDQAVFSPGGKQIATAGWDGSVRLWRRQDLDLAPLSAPRTTRFVATADDTVLRGDLEFVQVASPVGDVTVSAKIAPHGYVNIARPCLSPSGQRFAVACSDDTVAIYRRDGALESRFALGEEERDERHRFTVAFVDEDRLIFATEHRRVGLRDVLGGRIGKDSSVDLPGGVVAIAVNSSGDGCAFGGTQGGVAVHFLDGERIATFREHEDAVVELAWSPDGRYLASASQDGTALVYVADGSSTEVVRLDDHEGFVYSVAFSPNGERLVTGSFDGTARIWTLAGEQWARIDTGADTVWDTCWSPDGQSVWTALQRQGLRRWPATVEGLVELARGRSRPDSDREKERYEAMLQAVLLEGR